jgi:hypothetical protein
LGSRFVVPTAATSVDLVVHLALAPDGRRRVVYGWTRAKVLEKLPAELGDDEG